MDNSSYRSQYIQSGNENFSEQSVSVYDAFWKRLEKAERSIGKSLEDGYTTEEYAILIGNRYKHFCGHIWERNSLSVLSNVRKTSGRSS